MPIFILFDLQVSMNKLVINSFNLSGTINHPHFTPLFVFTSSRNRLHVFAIIIFFLWSKINVLMLMLILAGRIIPFPIEMDPVVYLLLSFSLAS